MTTQKAIQALWERGYSERKIARELGIHRNTVKNYLPTQAPAEARVPPTELDSKCTTQDPNPPPGSGPSESGKTEPERRAERGSECATEDAEANAAELSQTKPAKPAKPGPKSECEDFREIIEEKIEAELQAKRIWQDLVDDHGFKHSYSSVKRFVSRLKTSQPKRIWRLECAPGEEAQIDYGTIRLEIDGKRRKIHLLRVSLSHSRKAYSEAMPRQDTESFIRGIENAFRCFGGVPQLLVLDNLKAGVLKPDIYDPELNPKFEAFCEHYQAAALPTRPRTPEHKGKVENGIGYLKESAVKAKSFTGLDDLNRHLRHWESQVADKRIHGTTKRQVGSHFEQVERSALQDLPPSFFPSFVEAKRKVHRDSFIEFERAYYEVPPEYIARELWVRSDGKLVRLFNTRMDQIVVHPKLDPGQFSKTLGCGGCPSTVTESLRHWEHRLGEIGSEAGLWAKGLVLHRKAQGLRLMMGVVHQLLPRHGSEALNAACAQARLHGHYRMHQLKSWLENPAQQQQQAFEFLSEDEVIRDLEVYGQLAGFENNN